MTVLRRGLRQEHGVSTIMLALLALPMIGCIGLAVDAGNLYMAHSRLSYAADAGALAGGRVFYSDSRDADVKSYFSANFPQGYMGATVGVPTITESADRKQLTVAATAAVPTLFMQIFGFKTVNIAASSTIEREGGLEVALVLDVTGSMENPDPNKLENMKIGAKWLLDAINDPSLPADSVYAAIVPFRTAVNVGSTHTDWIDNSFNLGPTGPFAIEGWRGCLEQRSMTLPGSDGLPLDISDQVPSMNAYKFRPYLYENTAHMGPAGDGQATVTTKSGGTLTAKFDNNWPSPLAGVYGRNPSATGPNLNCPETPVTPLSPVQTRIADLKASIDSFTTVVRGGTEIVLGLTWGWHVLSDAWQSYWGTGIDTSRNRVKALVLLTDGNNEVVDWPKLPGSPASDSDPYGLNSDYTAYGRLRTLNPDGTVAETGPLGAASLADMLNKLTDRQLTICDAIKRQNITIYTIGYEVPAGAVAGLQACASAPDMYLPADQSTIQQTFKTIASQLSQLRIVK